MAGFFAFVTVKPHHRMHQHRLVGRAELASLGRSTSEAVSDPSPAKPTRTWLHPWARGTAAQQVTLGIFRG
jgi:hypothetical protein